MVIGDEKYVVVTTFRKSGVPVATPTWIVALEDGRVGFWTSSSSGKVARLKHTPRVTVQPSNARGKLREGTEPVDGVVELVTSGPVFDQIQTKVKAKYGIMAPISRFFNMLGHIGKGPFPYGDVAVVITV